MVRTGQYSICPGYLKHWRNAPINPILIGFILTIVHAKFIPN
jgi:hypothetical protein